MDISGKVAVITGGALGIGKKIAETLLEKGAKGVVILDINDKSGQDTQQELEDKFGNGKSVFQKCDVAKIDQIKAGFELAKSTFGHVDIVCNNAGIFDEVEWEKMFSINLNGVIYGTKLGIEYVEDGGVIINTSSLGGLTLLSLGPMYTTTKAAIIAFSRNMADESSARKKKIRTNCVCPSNTDGTDLLSEAVMEEWNRDKFAASQHYWTKITLDDVAKAFLKAIEEDLNGETLAIFPKIGVEVVENDHKRYRQMLVKRQSNQNK